MQTAERYAIHILGTDHDAVSNAFAKSAADGADKFAGIAFHRAHDGLPLLHDYITRLECTIVERVEAGDHILCIGRVDAADVAANEAAPLAFLRGRYASVA